MNEQFPFVMTEAELAAVITPYQEFLDAACAAEPVSFEPATAAEMTFTVAHYENLGKMTATNIAYTLAAPTRTESLGDYLLMQQQHIRQEADAAQLATAEAETSDSKKVGRLRATAKAVAKSGIFDKLVAPAPKNAPRPRGILALVA